MSSYKVLCNDQCQAWKNGGLSNACTAQNKLTDALRSYYGFTSFRPGQLEALLPVAHGQDTFVRMPTGGGKTLCMFLVPLSISCDAMGIIISPLVGLIQQQIGQLKAIGISATHAVAAGQIADIVSGKFRFVFMSPEIAVAAEWRKVFTNAYVKLKLTLIAVDEAHCITEWGKEFRKDFKRIGEIRALVDVPFMALTASAPPQVQADITNTLHLCSPITVSCCLDRPNVFISACPIASLSRDLHGFSASLKSPPPSIPKTILYVPSKNTACKVYHFLKAVSANKQCVGVYHADLTSSTKHSTYQEFSSSTSKLRCLVATIAFGMGMDIPDVDLVVVYGTPSTVAQLYQLFGRAGRNGSVARAHLFHTVRKHPEKDAGLQKFIQGGENCRRKCLLECLGDPSTLNSPGFECCDCCCKSALTLPLYAKLAVLDQGVATRRKRKVEVRSVDKVGLRAKLIQARQDFIDQRDDFYMVGVSFVCSDSAIDKLCAEAKYIKVIDDIPAELFGIWPDLKITFFQIICDNCSLVSCTNNSRKKRRLC